LSIVMTDRHATSHVASALSDGTLRFLALTVMEADPRSASLLCLEEPENGVHPQRVPAVIELLGDLAADATLAVDASNPLRQVIINTHSPSVVAWVDDGALTAAREARVQDAHGLDSYVMFQPLPNTWRTRAQPDVAPMHVGALFAFLDPLHLIDEQVKAKRGHVGATGRVLQRKDVQLAFDLAVGGEAA